MNTELAHLSFVKYFLAKSIGTLNPNLPYCISASTTVGEAITLLRDKRVGCVVITDHDSQAQGIFTERDFLNKIKSDNQLHEQVAKYMTPHPHCEPVTSSIAHALTLMSDGGYRHIPIIDSHNKVIGVISVKDIMNHLTRSLNHYYDELCGQLNREQATV